MNLSEKLAAADGPEPPPGDGAPARTSRPSEADGAAASGERRGPPGGIERRGTGTSPGPGKHPLRRGPNPFRALQETKKRL